MRENNVIYLKKDLTKKIKFVARSVWVTVGYDEYGKPVQKQHATIAVKLQHYKYPILHPLTDFIFQNFRIQSYNTMKTHATNVCAFLNYLLRNQRELKILSLKQLTFQHGTEFLNDLSLRKKARGTVLSYRSTLTSFYTYLAKTEIIGMPLSEFQSFRSKNGQSNYLSPFSNVRLPSPEANNIQHNLPAIYVLRFIELAAKYANPISLGVYLQIFGGLRVGEVVNIQRYDIRTIGPYAEDGLLLNIRKTQSRTDIRDSAGANYVKKPRNQLVLGYQDWLKTLYIDHQNNYLKHSDLNSLFINKLGQPMTASSYRYHFNKLKQAFIDYLTHSNNPHDKIAAISLKNSNWATHIGRGIFTNMIAEVAENPQEIALLRGDSNITSALTYMNNTQRMKKNLENYLDLVYTGKSNFQGD